MSSDVELNPGPSTYEQKDVVRSPAISSLELRLNQFPRIQTTRYCWCWRYVSLEQFHISQMEIQTVMALLEFLG